MGLHFMLLLSIYALYSNVTYIIYPVSCLVEIKLFHIVETLYNYLNAVYFEYLHIVEIYLQIFILCLS